MRTSVAALRAPGRVREAQRTRARDWFLRASRWEDDHWVLNPTSALDEDRPVIIRWDFSLPNGVKFTDLHFARLLESAKEHLAYLRTGPGRHRQGCSGATLRIYFQCLRRLIRWMSLHELERFADLNARSLEEFTHTLTRRRGRYTPQLSRTRLTHHYRVLAALYRDRHLVADSLKIDPFPGRTTYAVAVSQVRRQDRIAPCTPDAIAVPLIQGAIEFVSLSALPILAARERYLQAYGRTRKASANRIQAQQAAIRLLREISIDTPRGPFRIESSIGLWKLIELLYGACFVLISYLVGPRVSELLHLKAGCVQPFTGPGPDPSTAVAVITGAIFKHESYHGRRHHWVAPPPVLHAISVLEALSAPHRARSGRSDLWQRPRIARFMRGEWLPDSVLELRISDTASANRRVNGFASWLGLPLHKGRPWRFSSHQGRRTFARFVALRDRTALHALAQHLGHRDVRETDQGYVGTDYELNKEIEATVLDQSVCAWEQMLTARSLGGRMGAMVLARRPKFRGGRATREIRAYARTLASAGLTLGVCDWGYCVYREDYSACRGSMTAPDSVRREPSLCIGCKNFAVSDAHRPYWTDQVKRYEQLLNDPRLPTQTLKIARTRLEEARSLLRSMRAREEPRARP